MNPEHWLRTSIAGTSLIPSSRCRNTPLPGSKWSGVQVQYTIQSKSDAFIPAFASACSDACRASEAPVSPSDTQCRVLIPERWVIHSVRGIGIPCGKGAPGGDFAPDARLGKGVMDHTLTGAQYDAVRGARHQ